MSLKNYDNNFNNNNYNNHIKLYYSEVFSHLRAITELKGQ